MSDRRQLVSCAVHGQTVATLMCRHLRTGVACGFHSVADAYDPWPDAWCDLCEETLRTQGGFDAVAATTMEVGYLCAGCYEGARDRNRFIPPLARGAEAFLNDDERARLLRHAVAHVDAKNEAVRQQWGWHDPETFRFDAPTGRIVFDGGFHEPLVADAQQLGTWSEATQEFRWAWHGAEASHPQLVAASMARTYGVVRGIRKLTAPTFPCDEDEVWHLASVVAYVTGASALYAGRVAGSVYYMLLDGFRRGG